jgi:Fe-S cluster biogenesis protein NfuA
VLNLKYFQMGGVQGLVATSLLVSTRPFLSEDGGTCALRNLVDFEHDQLNSVQNVIV